MKNGYKMTELGEIPEDWEVVRLESVTTFQNGKAHEQHIDENGQFVVINSKFISSDQQVRKYCKKRLTPINNGDIAMVMSDIPNGKAIAKCFLVDEDNKYTVNQRIGLIRIVKNLDSKFLYYQINRNPYYLAFDNGVSQTNLRKQEVLACLISIPPISEQIKISDIITTIDQKLRVVDEKISKTRELKKGLMRRLFTKGIGHVETKSSELGEVPLTWGVVDQGSVAVFHNGRAFKLSEWENEGIPVIRLQNLTGSGNEYYYSNLKLPDHQYCYNGDLLYMWSATFGPVWWKGNKAIYHYHIWKIDVNKKLLDKTFHFYLLNQVTTRMKEQSHGSTMLHVTKSGMEQLKIALPPLVEQKKIAEILAIIDEKLQLLTKKKMAHQHLKRGLMQQLLTGKIRVNHLLEKEAIA
jgi:type I restriction enzyme, S subunit